MAGRPERKQGFQIREAVWGKFRRIISPCTGVDAGVQDPSVQPGPTVGFRKINSWVEHSEISHTRPSTYIQ